MERAEKRLSKVKTGERALGRNIVVSARGAERPFKGGTSITTTYPNGSVSNVKKLFDYPAMIMNTIWGKRSDD